MKRLVFVTIIMVLILSLCGCTQSDNDCIDIWNKSIYIFDNIKIKIKSGYFYDGHEKFTVDENTVGVTVYFSTAEEDEWKVKGGGE